MRFRQAGHGAASVAASGGECSGTNCGEVSPGFVGRGLLDADAQIVPRRLAGDRIAVGEAVAALALGQQFGDQVIEQEAARRLRRVGVERGGAGAPADRVPGPHRVGIDAFHQPDAALDAADARS